MDRGRNNKKYTAGNKLAKNKQTKSKENKTLQKERSLRRYLPRQNPSQDL